MRTLLALAIPCIVAGCVSAPLTLAPPPPPDREMKLWYFDHEAMEGEVLKFVPVGTPLEQARKIMTDNGFRCEEVNCDLGLPYLRCYALYKPATLFDPVAQEIWCQLRYESGAIKKVEVHCVESAP